MHTLAPIIRDSPVLAGAIFILIAVFLFLVIAITSAHRRSRPKPPPPSRSRREPDFSGDVYDFDELDRDYGRPQRDDHLETRAERGGRFGFAGLTVSFLIGLLVGISGLALSARISPTSAVDALFSLMQTNSSTAREEARGTERSSKPAAPKVAAKVPAPLPRPAVREVQVASAPADDIGQRLTNFVNRLRSELPKPVGPQTSLTSVDAVGLSVTLGYSIASVPTAEEAAALQSSLKGIVTPVFCGGKAGEVRFLNDNGIAFDLVYVDQTGKTVGKLTAQPRFCDTAE